MNRCVVYILQKMQHYCAKKQVFVLLSSKAIFLLTTFGGFQLVLAFDLFCFVALGYLATVAKKPAQEVRYIIASLILCYNMYTLKLE